MQMTMFGDVEWGDSQSMWNFLTAHDLKHQALARVLADSNVQSPAFLLTAQIEDNWVQTHYQQHVLLSQAITQSVDSSIYNLLSNPLTDEDTFYNWFDIHDIIHQQLDQGLGISGT
jgi:hypothetical protein